ncbi:DMT family transporter [Cytobacillus sp. IB215316]|uniref:DMT family transporter n=1 Tax=Cytobacillus sp. IB215316 TaxID=3097354 RepID=UPI002A1408E9|nr:DMT family transporter [Cytobacillus sp. IB215316]MDX8360935.1 DMT family transporter [Cytobacillus sp. IB215316]
MKKLILNPYAALIIGVISVSTSAVIVKVITAPAPVIAFYRMLFAVLFISPIFLIKNMKEMALMSKREWIYSIGAGIFLAFHFILWFESLQYTSVASSVVFVSLQPLFAFVGTMVFFQERITFKAFMTGLLAIIGSFIISIGDLRLNGSALLGDILAIFACVMVTAYLLLGQYTRKRLAVITYTFVVYGVSTITLFIYVVLLGYPLLQYPTADWYYFLLLAIVPTLLGHSLFNWTLKWLSTATVSIGILFEPVGASILAYFILGEQVIWTQVIGGAIIIFAIAYFIVESNARRFGKSIK